MAKKATSQKVGQATENRKLRNRLSQQAYRARQCMRIKELEERLSGHSQGESARIKEIEEQNRQLRDQLLSCHKKLESLSLSMKALADCAAKSLGIESGSGACKASSTRQDSGTLSGEESIPVLEATYNAQVDKDDLVQQDIAQVPELICSLQQSTDQYMDREHESTPRSQELAIWPGTSTPISNNLDSLFRHGSSNSASCFGSNLDIFYQNMSPFCQTQLPSYAGMGATSYAHAISRAPLLIRGPHGDLHKSNSLFSDHIAVVEHFLKQKWASPRSLLKHGEEGSVIILDSRGLC
jgi:hypothetical protein